MDRHRYRVAALASLVVVMVGIWPVLLTPIGRSYVDFCARYLTDAPFSHHYPPLLVAFLMLAAAPLLIGLAVASIRQFTGQRHLNAVLMARAYESGEHVRHIVARVQAHGHVVVTTDKAVYAFCSGIIRPRIYLSYGLLDLLTEDEIEAVVRHELHHVARRDPLRFFVSQLARQLAALFPVLVTMDDWVRVRAELAADRAALSAVSFETLASALIKVARAAPVAEHRAILAGFTATDARVAALLGRPVRIPLNRRDVLVSLGVVLNLVVILSWLATQALPLPPDCSVCPPF